jgi:4-hydroxy-tetrahydrodipicolinate synthase
MPGLVRFSLSPALLLRLQHSYPAIVVGLKDSSGDWNVTRTYISALKHTGFKVYCGSETFLLQTLREGGAGCISATANINGPAIAQLASR